MGRPTLCSPYRRRNSLQCYLTDSEYHRVGRIAYKQDKHMSAWLREIILNECSRKESGNDGDQ